MAEKKENNKQGAKKAKEQQPKAKEKKEAEKKESKKSKRLSYLIVAMIIVIIAVGVYYVLTNYVSTPFSTFKSNFIAAPRVALVVSYKTINEYSNESVCFPQILQYVAHTRNASTIDFFIVNQSNATCIYQVGGLGHINIATKSASACLSVARSEPSIFLNYSSGNYTVINLFHLYVSGDSHYMTSCPIAAELG